MALLRDFRNGAFLTAIETAQNWRARDKNDINFLLYCTSSSNNEFTEMILDDKESLTGFHPNMKTKVLVHGFYSHAFSEFPRNIKDAYLDTYKDECNVICVNWCPLSGVVRFGPNSRIITHLEGVTEAISKFLIALVLEETVQLDLSNVHLVGHCVGARICGWVAEAVVKSGSKAIGRISALDAACNCYNASIRNSVQKTGTDFLDTYNTSKSNSSHRVREDTHFDRTFGHVNFFIKLSDSEDTNTVQTCVHVENHRIFCKTIKKRIGQNQSSTSKEGQVSASSSTQESITVGQYCSPGTTGEHHFVYRKNSTRKPDYLTGESDQEKDNRNQSAGKSK